MKHIAKEYHIWKRKATNRTIGKVVEIKDGDSIDNYVEVELSEPVKKMINVIREWKAKRGK